MASILNTRTLPNSGSLTRALREQGHTVTEAALLRVEPTSAAPPQRIAAATVVFVTSAHAVEAACAYRHLPAYAVGATTARALREGGFDDVRTGPGDGPGLSRMLLADGVEGPVLYPCAETVSFDAVSHWRKHGIEGLAWPVYRTVPAALDESIVERLRAGGFDHIIVTSARSAKALLRHAPEPVGPTRISVLSDRIREALPAQWRARTQVAAEPNETELLSLTVGV